MPKGHPLPPNPSSKTCMDCGVTGPLENFHANTEYSDGRIPRCKKCQKIYVKALWALAPEKKRAYEKRRYTASREKTLQRLKETHATRRLMVLCHYGGEPPQCKCCGESQYEFLAIDHINDNGAEHRRMVGGTSMAMIRWIIKNGYPEGLQILCHNCNAAKEHYGGCPHQRRSA